MREPVTLLGRRVEAAILDHTNPRVLDGHVLSAAFEAPLDDADRETLGDAALERAPLLPELKRTSKGFVWAGRTSRGSSFRPGRRGKDWEARCWRQPSGSYAAWGSGSC